MRPWDRGVGKSVWESSKDGRHLRWGTADLRLCCGIEGWGWGKSWLELMRLSQTDLCLPALDPNVVAPELSFASFFDIFAKSLFFFWWQWSECFR